MRRHLTFAIRLSILFLFAGASIATSQTAVVVESPHAELIQTLRAAHSLLVHADHDYDGHRAKAAEEVHKALRELGYEHKSVKAATTPESGVVIPPQTVVTGQPKVHEPQANSDIQLRKARRLLEGALTQLPEKHVRAAENVHAAIREIRMALKDK